MKQSEKKHVQELIQTLVQLGLRHVVLSPGSRNAPISYSFTFHPDVTTYSVTDERSAGFVALGMAQTLKEPVAVVCTSGSAAINYGPAAAEAYYQHIPLVILTADRPKELIDQGIGQSIRQPNMYANYIKGSFEIEDPEGVDDAVWDIRRQVNDAWNLSISGHPGPVHINIPLAEPLYGMVETEYPEIPLEREIPAKLRLGEEEIAELKETLENSPKVLVILGQMNGEFLPDEFAAWTQKNNVIILTETTGNVQNEGIFPCIDQLIMSMSAEQAEAFVPDLLITAGHNLISRKIKSMLKGRVKTHWHVDPVDQGLDTFQCLSSTISVSSNQFFYALADYKAPENGSYRAEFEKLHTLNRASHTDFLEQCPFSDLAAFAQILPALPEESMLQMGNSSVVRYIQLFEPRTDVLYKGNRGVSGIDGCTSTAIGAAYPLASPVTLITGDLAFFYDVNGLWNDLLPDNLKIIVINNSGGGIFRIIDGPAQSGVLEEVFELPHTRNAKSVCADFNIPYHTATNGDELQNNLDDFFGMEGMALLEVFTPRELNDAVLKDYFMYLKQQASSYLA